MLYSHRITNHMRFNKPLVSIVVVNWNGGEVFANCLSSLNKINYPNWELIVVDNASTDGSLTYAKKITKAKRVKTLKNSENLGFALANNQGFEVARGKYILLLNNDTLVQKDFLDVLVTRIEKTENIGAVQPKIFVMDQPKRLDNAGSFLTLTGFLEHWGFLDIDGPKYSKERIIFSAKGACMLIKRSVIEKIGLFDPDFGSYFEESDFCWRLWLAGYQVLFIPDAYIYHKVGFSSKRQNQIFVNYHSYKNRFNSLVKNLEPSNLVVIGGFQLVILFILTFYYALTLQISKSGMITRAIWWNVSNLRKTLVKRADVQTLRKKKDSEIFPHILIPIDLKSIIIHFLRSEKVLRNKHSV